MARGRRAANVPDSGFSRPVFREVNSFPTSAGGSG
jgi:hypothetical protein